jgi:hypothetical protein
MNVMTLESTIAIDLTELQLEMVRLIDTENFEGVKRKVREEFAHWGETVSEEFLEAGVLALKQYYAVALLDPYNEHAVSDSIDPFWHAHILHTKEYIAFGERIFGQYVHHEPLDHDNATQLRHVARLYAYTTNAYRKMFSHIDAAFYPEVMPDAQLLCSHQEIYRIDLRQATTFPAVNIDKAFAHV